MSVERVGGVEPETVTAEAGFAAQSKAYCDMADQMCRERNEAQRELSVQRATLRSVEEELRQARAAHEDAMLAEGHIIETLEADVDRLSRLFDASWADRDRLTRELRQAREERDALAKDADEIAFALVKRTQQRDKAEADRDRLAFWLRAARPFIGSLATAPHGSQKRRLLDAIDAALSPVGQDDPRQEQGATFASMDECIADLQERQRTASGGQGVRDDDSEATR